MRAAISTMVAAAVAASLSAHAAPAVDDQGSADQIEQIEHRLGMVADASQVSSFYTDDATLYDGLAPGIYHGISAITAVFAAQLKGVKSIDTQFLELTTQTSGQLGFAYSVQRIQIFKDDGTHQEIVCRVTDVFMRVKGKWLIVQQHLSYPIDPATGKGLFDSVPSKAG